MARNQEKAQSMLYRFREAQATSLGLSPKPNARRPRLASSVTSLKECERWRADVIREISRKVSKIQDFGLTDYEVRDLNDEINKLLREKVHWENQIVNLGGANYRRGGVPSMLGGDEGKAGRGGYKYFGRAKDLPGVKELFSSTEAEEGVGRREDRYQRFRNLPPSYFGDEDEDDGVLLEEEMRGEEAEWNEGFLAVITGLRRDVRRRDGDAEDQEEMEVSEDDEDTSESGGIVIPTIPRPTPKPWKENLAAFTQSFSESYIQPSSSQEAASTPETTKRSQDADQQDESTAKRQKGSDGQPVPTPTATAQELSSPPTPSVSYSIFTPQDLAHPNVPDRTAIERMILMAKKRQLRQEYIGSS
ncbi:probable Pre-mRNA-splicing factor ISY1 [Ustilago trichophora]|uniref:Probable Pre-mRNA-splicing factor ISY1 n=1 Tax=Ustilago trichophora TaxID=86804 RepID=A0A5C3DX04_9BASI|nr:probable Pre-mRNA-splicing factor ISY1 [Ustilago trichophora]